MKTLRLEFADTMSEVGQCDPRLVVMVGDISHGILQGFAKACPGRYYNIGICEPTIVNMAAGLNKVGLVPVVHTIAPFITERAYEQIKLDFGYQHLSGNIVSVGGSFDYAQLGCSHHCYTDVSLLCHLKRATVTIPGSPVEFNTLFKKLYATDGIHYYRLPERPHGIEFAASDLVPGRGIRLREGSDLTIATIAPQLSNALAAAERLAASGLSAELLYFPMVKPFDQELLRASLGKTKRLLVVEELSAHDGLLNLCLRAAIGLPGFSVRHLALQDFLHGYGTHEELSERAGFSPQGIAKSAHDLCSSP